MRAWYSAYSSCVGVELELSWSTTSEANALTVDVASPGVRMATSAANVYASVSVLSRACDTREKVGYVIHIYIDYGCVGYSVFRSSFLRACAVGWIAERDRLRPPATACDRVQQKRSG